MCILLMVHRPAELAYIVMCDQFCEINPPELWTVLPDEVYWLDQCVLVSSFCPHVQHKQYLWLYLIYVASLYSLHDSETGKGILDVIG